MLPKEAMHDVSDADRYSKDFNQTPKLVSIIVTNAYV